MSVRLSNSTPWRLLRSLQAVLWAVLVLCVGNALAYRTVNPLDLPQAETADTAKIRAVAEAKSAEILALEEIADSAGIDVGEKLRTPYSYVGNGPLVGVDPTGMIDLGNGQATIPAPSPGEVQPLSEFGWQCDKYRDRAIGLMDGSPFALQPMWILFHPEVIDEKKHQEAAVTSMVFSTFALEAITGGLSRQVHVESEIPLSRSKFGHTFEEHGQSAAHFARMRAMGGKEPAGYFTDDQIAARFITENLPTVSQGPVNIRIPEGFPARVAMPDGSLVAPKFVRIVPKQGGVKTAYPTLTENGR